MDEETRKRIEKRAQELLDEDPKQRSARVMRKLAERIAYHEVLAEKEREQAKP